MHRGPCLHSKYGTEGILSAQQVGQIGSALRKKTGNGLPARDFLKTGKVLLMKSP